MTVTRSIGLILAASTAVACNDDTAGGPCTEEPCGPGDGGMSDGPGEHCDPDDPSSSECELQVCASGAEYATIAEAIEAAPDGGRIVLCAGTYAESVQIAGKPLWIVGSDGAEATILDVQTRGTAVTVVDTGGPGVILEGLTIRNGLSTVAGGGVSCSGSVMALRDSVVENSESSEGGGVFASECQLDVLRTRISGNDGGELGGGLAIHGGSGSIKASEIQGNVARDGGGAAIVAGDFEICDSLFAGNHALLQGGGLHYAGNALIEGNTFSKNTAGWIGGGVYLNEGEPTFRDNEVSESMSENDGGGVYIFKGAGHFVGNRIIENVSGDDGGGFRFFESAARVENNRVEGNYASDSGGGIRVSHVALELINNQILNNEAGGVGGGIDMDNDSSVLRGGAIVGNRAGGSGGGIHAWLWPWFGGLIEDVRIADNRAHRGGAIYLEFNFQKVTLRGLDISGNKANYGGGIWVRTTHFSLRHSSFRGNTASKDGGALMVGAGGRKWEDVGESGGMCPCPPLDTTGTIDFITAHDNSAGDRGSALWVRSPSFSVRSSIFSSNPGSGVVAVGPEENPIMITPPSWHYNNTVPASFEGMSDPTGTQGNMSTNPMFADGTGGDFTLMPGSPCVDAGDPAYVDGDGSRADMGIFGGLGTP